MSSVLSPLSCECVLCVPVPQKSPHNAICLSSLCIKVSSYFDLMSAVIEVQHMLHINSNGTAKGFDTSFHIACD